MCGPKFCSMKITADVREYAEGMTDNEKAALYPDLSADLSAEAQWAKAEASAKADVAKQGLSPHPEEARRAVSKDEAEAGMAQMSEKFKALGSEVYVDAVRAAKNSNKAL